MAGLTDDVSFDIYLTDGDIAENREFPPSRFSLRDARLAALYRLWKGDFSEYKIANLTAVNYFGSYSTKLANLLLMSPPEAGSLMLADAAYDALIDMTRFGGAVLMYDGETVRAADPTSWYPGRDADYFLKPFVSDDAMDANQNRANIMVVPFDAPATSIVFEWERGRLGKAVSSEQLAPIFVYIVPRTPHVGIWGTSKYIELCDPIIEIARRFSKNSRLLDLYASPIPTYKASLPDARAKFGVDTALTDAEAIEKVQAGVFDIFEEGFLFQEDDVTEVALLQPNTRGVGFGLNQVESLSEAINTLTGMPSLAGPHQPPPSGEAFKRMFLHLYAESMAMQSELREGFEALTGVEVTWPHIFDVLEAQAAPAPAPAPEASPEPTE